MRELLRFFFKTNSIISKIVKKLRLTNSFYYTIKKEIIKKVLIKYPPYGVYLHDNIVSSFWDPIRFASISLAINTIKNEDIKGSLAEVGVFQGESSKIIHLLTPKRKLYLFDTFEGFPRKYLKNDLEINRFKDTNLEMVKKNIGNMNNVIIRKGIFPDTARNLENEQFSFVSIDVDLYDSTLEGLEFFYPRITKGGFIFIHDYNNPYESNNAVFRAVKEFMRNKPEKIIEIPDINGTAIIRKN